MHLTPRKHMAFDVYSIWYAYDKLHERHGLSLEEEQETRVDRLYATHTHAHVHTHIFVNGFRRVLTTLKGNLFLQFSILCCPQQGWGSSSSCVEHTAHSPPTCLYVHLCVCLSACLHVWLPACVSAFLSVCVSPTNVQTEGSHGMLLCLFILPPCMRVSHRPPHAPRWYRDRPSLDRQPGSAQDHWATLIFPDVAFPMGLAGKSLWCSTIIKKCLF